MEGRRKLAESLLNRKDLIIEVMRRVINHLFNKYNLMSINEVVIIWIS